MWLVIRRWKLNAYGYYLQYRVISIPFMPFLYKIVEICPAPFFWDAACPKGYVKAFGWAVYKYRME